MWGWKVTEAVTVKHCAGSNPAAPVELCCFIHSQRTTYCAAWDFVNDTTQEYARLDFFGLAPSTALTQKGKPE